MRREYMLFNKLGQVIKYRGQLCKGDEVRCHSTDLEVLEVEGDTGKLIFNHNPSNTYNIKYIKGKGWVY